MVWMLGSATTSSFLRHPTSSRGVRGPRPHHLHERGRCSRAPSFPPCGGTPPTVRGGHPSRTRTLRHPCVHDDFLDERRSPRPPAPAVERAAIVAGEPDEVRIIRCLRPQGFDPSSFLHLDTSESMSIATSWVKARRRRRATAAPTRTEANHATAKAMPPTFASFVTKPARIPTASPTT